MGGLGAAGGAGAPAGSGSGATALLAVSGCCSGEQPATAPASKMPVNKA